MTTRFNWSQDMDTALILSAERYNGDAMAFLKAYRDLTRDAVHRAGGIYTRCRTLHGVGKMPKYVELLYALREISLTDPSEATLRGIRSNATNTHPKPPPAGDGLVWLSSSEAAGRLGISKVALSHLSVGTGIKKTVTIESKGPVAWYEEQSVMSVRQKRPSDHAPLPEPAPQPAPPAPAPLLVIAPTPPPSPRVRGSLERIENLRALLRLYDGDILTADALFAAVKAL